jgi:hypothetical protein
VLGAGVSQLLSVTRCLLFLAYESDGGAAVGGTGAAGAGCAVCLSTDRWAECSSGWLLLVLAIWCFWLLKVAAALLQAAVGLQELAVPLPLG